MVASRATHPIPCKSRSTWVYAVPGCLDTHGITWRTTACAWTHACLGCAWPHMGPWPHGMLPVGGCFHGRTCSCTHDLAWKRMYGSCGSMKAWSDMGPAPAVVCRWPSTASSAFRNMFRNTCTPMCSQNIHGHRLAAGSFHSQLAQQCLCRLLAPTEDVPAFYCI